MLGYGTKKLWGVFLKKNDEPPSCHARQTATEVAYQRTGISVVKTARETVIQSPRVRAKASRLYRDS